MHRRKLRPTHTLLARFVNVFLDKALGLAVPFSDFFGKLLLEAVVPRS